MLRKSLKLNRWYFHENADEAEAYLTLKIWKYIYFFITLKFVHKTLKIQVLSISLFQRVLWKKTKIRFFDLVGHIYPSNNKLVVDNKLVDQGGLARLPKGIIYLMILLEGGHIYLKIIFLTIIHTEFYISVKFCVGNYKIFL